MDRISKKNHPNTKHFVLCKKPGGMRNCHNTSDCCKYEKDGTPKKTFAEKKHAQSYMHLSDKLVKLSKLEKAHKKLKKTSSGKRKH